MNTNPFLKIPMILPGNENEGDEPKEAHARVLPETVQSYHPCYHWGSLIYFIGGNCIMTKLSCDELDRVFAHYWNQVNQLEKQKESAITLLQ